MKIRIAVAGAIIAVTFFGQPAFAATSCVAGSLPDAKCTPGAVLTTDIKTICKVGYTKTVRDVTLATRKKVFAAYGIPWSQHSSYEVDHLIPLEVGGSNDIKNLWPEWSAGKTGSISKDSFENYLHRQVCSGKMKIQEAQQEIATNWLKFAPKKY